MLGALHPERDREDIARFHLLHQWFIERPHERKWVRCRLRHTLPLKEAEQKLRVVSGCFSLRDAKDALPLPVALDQGGNPEDCFKHMLLLSVRM